MNTSIKTRALAFIASTLVTAITVVLIAGYAYPEPASLRLASTQH